MKLEELPPRISEYMGSYFSILKNIKLADRYKLRDSQLSELASTLGDVFLKTVEVQNLPAELKKRLNLEDPQAFLLAADSAEQHFTQFQDFFGPTNELPAQWRTWGHDLGGKEPAANASPRVEHLISQAGRAPVSEPTIEQPAAPVRPKLDFKKAVVSKSPQTAPAMTGVPTSQPTAQTKTVGQQVAARREQQQTQEQQQQSRERFLQQLRNFSIDSLRPPGQSAGDMLLKIRDRIGQVMAQNPQDRIPVSAALRTSPLFKLYQEQGQEIIRSGQPVDTVIYQRYQGQKPYLLREEFEAVATLMKSL